VGQHSLEQGSGNQRSKGMERGRNAPYFYKVNAINTFLSCSKTQKNFWSVSG